VGKTQKNLVKRLKELRKIHGITQEQFSERTGISYKYYQAVETGVKKELRISTLERFADAYPRQVCLRLRVNRLSIVWLAARRQGSFAVMPGDFHLDDARFAGSQTGD